MGKPPTPKQVQLQIVDMYESGISGGEVARRLSIGQTTVYRYLERAGLVLTGLHGKYSEGGYRKFSDEKEKEILQLHQAQWSCRQLGIRYACSTSCIARMLKRHGLKPHRPGKKRLVLTQAEVDRVHQLHNQGTNQKAIAKQLGIGDRQVSRTLKNEMSVFKKGEEPPSQRVERSNRYEWVWVPKEHPFASMRTVSGGILIHRLRMAEKLQRPLYKWETVHHIDGDPRNNQIGNLQLRLGKHGKHVAYCCADCGSTNIKPMKLKDP